MGGGERASVLSASRLAVLATIPRRSALLEKTLASLRPQVDKLHVFLNGYALDQVPACVRELADQFAFAAENEGAERKFYWADKHEGVYLSCDDDITYPDNYVETMVGELSEHPDHLVTAHGRTFLGKPSSVHEVAPGSIGIYHRRVDNGHAVNHGGTGVMCWDTRSVRMPTEWPLQNIADMQVAVWAQLERVPMWLIGHQANWLKSDTLHDPNSIWHASRVDGHRRRSDLLRQHGERTPWRMFATR
jgi:hypothetical protein